MDTHISDVSWKIDSVDDNSLGIARAQDIPDTFISDLRDDRLASMNAASGDIHRVASIPAVLVVKWLNEGFDVFRAPLRDTMKRLREEGFDDFIATSKRI